MSGAGGCRALGIAWEVGEALCEDDELKSGASLRIYELCWRLSALGVPWEVGEVFCEDDELEKRSEFEQRLV